MYVNACNGIVLYVNIPMWMFVIAVVLYVYVCTKEFEDTKGVIRICKSKKNRQHNGQKKKDKQRSTKHTHKTKDRATQIPLKIRGELRCSGMVSSYCSTSGIRRVVLYVTVCTGVVLYVIVWTAAVMYLNVCSGIVVWVSICINTKYYVAYLYWSCLLRDCLYRSCLLRDCLYRCCVLRDSLYMCCNIRYWMIRCRLVLTYVYRYSGVREWVLVPVLCCMHVNVYACIVLYRRCIVHVCLLRCRVLRWCLERYCVGRTCGFFRVLFCTWMFEPVLCYAGTLVFASILCCTPIVYFINVNTQ